MSTIHDLVGSWDKFTEPIFQDREVREDLKTINKLYYSRDTVVFPAQKNVFRAFQKCPYDKLAVIMILQDPYHDGMATGIAMGNERGTKNISPSLRIVKDTISRTIYNYHEFDFDTTLEKWESQGVLMLNTALTVESGRPLSHQKLWSRFTTLLLTRLSEVNCGIIYCLWGKYADSFSMYINQETNTILRCTHPVYAAYRGQSWDCDHFVKINEQLKKNNNTSIEW